MPEFLNKIKNFFLNLNDGGIFCIWVFAILLAASLLWGLTGKSRAGITVNAVNRLLYELGEDRRVVSAINEFGMSGISLQTGKWFILNSREKAVIFPLIVDGTLSPCLGIVSTEGLFTHIVPLSKNAEKSRERMSEGLLQIWIDRIEKSAVAIK
ncbi:MAG: hypothetical protein Ta2B_29090 [Termitinemataceae bacterium]|nr:MAG: hypothetical protein Ta2B_29090 [Termitinemataceae bacterium]